MTTARQHLQRVFPGLDPAAQQLREFKVSGRRLIAEDSVDAVAEAQRLGLVFNTITGSAGKSHRGDTQ